MGATGQSPKGKGFTLIELLIVVAIIAILAAIAVPNFLEAQTRAKVARVQSEFYNIGIMLEAYHTDWNWYPADYMPYEYCGWDSQGLGSTEILNTLRCLTTPVAYLSSVPYLDPFGDPTSLHKAQYLYENLGDQFYWWFGCGSGAHPHHDRLCPGEHTVCDTLRRCLLWWLRSYGPDHEFQYEPVIVYDGSNGTVSVGDIFRVGP